MAEPMGDMVDELLRRIGKLEETNGALCDEINRQERVIESQVELIDNRDESIHNLVKVLDKRQERVKALESLVLDAERLLTMWDKADWDCAPDEDKMGDYEPEGNLRVLQERIAALGEEVDR